MSKLAVLFDADGQLVALVSNGKAVPFSCELSDQPIRHPDVSIACWACHKRRKEQEEAAKLECGICRQVSYCNAECQKQHWPVHQLSCHKEEMKEEEEEEEEPYDDSEDIPPPDQDEELESQLVEMPRGGGFRGGGGGFRGGGFRGGRIPGGRVPGGSSLPGRAIMPRRGGMLPRSSFRTSPWGRTWHSSYWARSPLFWGLWGRYYNRWYPSNYWYVPNDYYYDDDMALPSLDRKKWHFDPLINPTQAQVDEQAQMIAQIRADIISRPEIRAAMARTGFDIVPDVERGFFVWISTGGPV